MTSKWKRSPRGKVFGVITGLAEWKQLDPQTARFIAAIIAVCTMPASIIIYLILALILPMQTEDDYMNNGSKWSGNGTRQYSNAHRKHSGPVDYEDAKWEDKSNEDLRKEYEELKKKVEAMESEMFDREKDWDERFRES